MIGAPNYGNEEIPEADAPEIDQVINNRVYCPITKVNYFDESQPIFGYPVNLVENDDGKYTSYLTPVFTSFKALPKNIKTDFTTKR